jgi:hypothetical protein
MTRSEALLAALEQVGDNISGVDNRIDQAISLLENNSYEHAAEMRAALVEHGKSIEDAGQSLANGLIVSSVLAVTGNAFNNIFNKVIDIAIQRGKSEAQTIQLVSSIFSLQQRHGPMEYNFIVDRSYAQDTTTDERRTLINGLIHSGFMEDDNEEYPQKLFMDEDRYDEFFEIYSAAYGITQIENNLEE